MLELTQNAQNALNEVIADTDKPIAGLRVRVTGGGCSGFQYALSLEEETPFGDVVVETGGLNVFVHPQNLQHLEETVIDFMQGAEGVGFVFSTPNVGPSCGGCKSICP